MLVRASHLEAVSSAGWVTVCEMDLSKAVRSNFEQADCWAAFILARKCLNAGTHVVLPFAKICAQCRSAFKCVMLILHCRCTVAGSAGPGRGQLWQRFVSDTLRNEITHRQYLVRGPVIVIAVPTRLPADGLCRLASAWLAGRAVACLVALRSVTRCRVGGYSEEVFCRAEASALSSAWWLTALCLLQVLAELDPEADAELGLPEMVGQYHSIYPLEDVAQVRSLAVETLAIWTQRTST